MNFCLLVLILFCDDLSYLRSAVVVRAATSSINNDIPYRSLAKVVQEKISQRGIDGVIDAEELPSLSQLTKSLSKLASNQQTFKVSVGFIIKKSIS